MIKVPMVLLLLNHRLGFERIWKPTLKKREAKMGYSLLNQRWIQNYTYKMKALSKKKYTGGQMFRTQCRRKTYLQKYLYQEKKYIFLFGKSYKNTS